MAVLTSAEVNEQAELSYVRGTYSVALTLQTSTDYTSGVSLATIEADEVTVGDGGYARLTYTYDAADLLAYSNGQPLAQKQANFVHDGSSTDIEFNYVVLLRTVGADTTVVGFQKLAEVVNLTNGNFARFDINILHGAG
jgi:hypothetical protein